MQVKEYLFYNEITIADFAIKIGVNKQTIYKITQGKSKMLRTDVIDKIVSGTDGKVTYEDIMNEIKGQKPTFRE